MTFEEMDAFRAAFNVRSVERCCGTCRHFVRDYEEAWCGNPRQVVFDSAELELLRTIPNHTPDYDIHGGTEVDEGQVCDLWEAREDGKI